VFLKENDVTTKSSAHEPARQSAGADAKETAVANYTEQAKVVQLAGTEVSGTETVGTDGTKYTRYGKWPSPVGDAIFEAVDGWEREVTDGIIALSALLGRLRSLKVFVLDGDATAVEQGEEIVTEADDDRLCLVDEDAISVLTHAVAGLEKLTSGRTETHSVRNIKPPDIETTVRDLIVPFLDGNYVTVRTCPVHRPDWPIEDASVTLERQGHIVDVEVRPRAVPPPIPEGTPLHTVMQKLIAAKGERTANAILKAVRCVARQDEAQQLELLWKAVRA
jgi:hypothetical protein